MLRTTEEGKVINNKGFVNNAISSDDPRLVWMYPKEMSLQEGEWLYLVVEPGNEQALPNTRQPYACIVEYAGKDAHITIPEQLGGYPVREVFHKVFYSMQFVWSIYMPDSVERVGMKAFAFCRSLRDLRLSDALQELPANMLLRCTGLQSLHLPANLTTFYSRVVEDCPIEELCIPQGCTQVDATYEELPKLKTLNVHPDNPCFSSDGDALYSKDGSTLIKVLRNVPGYKVQPGCKYIGNNAFKGLINLIDVSLCEGLETIGDYAFMRTGLVTVYTPNTLTHIGQRAFYRCQYLRDVTFGASCSHIGSGAFASTALQEVHLPEDLRMLGSKVFEDTPVLYNPKQRFSINPNNPWLKTDGDALFCKLEDGWYVADMLSDAEIYHVPPGIVGVLPKAFAHNNRLQRVTFPQGLESIGEEAFVSCSKLEVAVFPASLKTICQRAFWETSLVGIHLGTNVEEIGDSALVTRGYLPGTATARPAEVVVDNDNPHFYIENNLLCQRGDKGDQALIFFGEAEEVHLPDKVTHIGDYCFRNACIGDLYIHDHVASSGKSSFAGISNLKFLHLALSQPFQGQEEIMVRFPGTANLPLLYTHCLCMGKDGGFFDFEAYDLSIVHGADASELCAEIITRYDYPYRLTEVARRSFESSMHSVMHAAARNFIENRDMKGFNRLADHGFLNAANIDELLEEARVDVSAEATAYLLDMKNRRFGIREEDFAL